MIPLPGHLAPGSCRLDQRPLTQRARVAGMGATTRGHHGQRARDPFGTAIGHKTHTNTTWVTPEDAVVISIGAVSFTASTRRTAFVHALNHVLRRLGARPRRAGHHDWLDRLNIHSATSWWRCAGASRSPAAGGRLTARDDATGAGDRVPRPRVHRRR